MPIHPNAFHATRPRWGASGAKSDPGDSYKLADYLRTEATGCAGWNRSAPAPASCRRWSGCATTTSPPRSPPPTSSAPCWTPLARRQAAVLPARLQIALAFLADYPTPQAAARLGEARMATFCRRHAYCGRRARPSCSNGSAQPPSHRRA